MDIINKVGGSNAARGVSDEEHVCCIFKPLIPQQRRRQSSDVVPNRSSNSSNINQRSRPLPQATPASVQP